MPYRHLLFVLVIFGLLSTALISRPGIYAEKLNSDSPDVGDGTEEIGKWLRIVKSTSSPYVNRNENAQFTIVVLNTSPNFAMVNVNVTDQWTPTCEKEFDRIPPSGKENYICSHPDVQVAFTNGAVVTGENATTGASDQASDTARIEVLELLAAIEPETDAIPSPGRDLEFTVTLTNQSSVKVELGLLTSPELGNLGDPQNDNVQNNNCPSKIGETLSANGGSVECTFTTIVSGEPGDYPYNITASGTADDVAPISGSGATVVKIFDIISVSLNANNEKYPTGSIIQLKALIRNLSETSSVTIIAMEDIILGDVGCTLPATIEPGGEYTCNYEQLITAAPGEEQSFILEVSAETDDTPPISVTKKASETVTVVEPLIYLPITTKIPRPTTCETALKINTNTSYQSIPNTKVEYYKFILTEETEITVKITNFSVSIGQVQVYRYAGEDCDIDTKIIELFDGGFEVSRTLGPKILKPETYYVAVVNSGSLSVKEAYTLIVEAK